MNKVYEIYSGKLGFWLTVISLLGVIIMGVERHFDHKYFQKEVSEFIEEAECFMEHAEEFMYLQHGINSRNEVINLMELQDEMDSNSSADGDSP